MRVSVGHRGKYCDVVDAELPAVPVSAGALIFDRGGRLLILKPTYKSGWTIPGGVMEADGEMRRVRAGTRRRRCVYLENGRPVPGIS